LFRVILGKANGQQRRTGSFNQNAAPHEAGQAAGQIVQTAAVKQPPKEQRVQLERPFELVGWR
jgi:hypothetical protein